MESFTGAERTTSFTESVIREMTRLVNHLHSTDGINLAQGFPDFSAPRELKDAACRAIQDNVNQYAITWGAKNLRDGIAWKTRHFLGIDVDPEREITVTCGATEGMASVMLGLLNPGDEAVIFEPFYGNYGPDCALCGAIPRYVPLLAPDWKLDRDVLSAAFGPRTRAIVINTPNNPTGKVFTRDELLAIAELCEQWNCLMFTDEIYEHILYDGALHVSPATLPNMRERTVIVNGLSKTYSVTGWRVGYVIAPAQLTDAIRKVHDFLTVGAAAPLQAAGAAAVCWPEAYYQKLRDDYQQRRDYLIDVLRKTGLEPIVPLGAYYTMVDIRPFGFRDDVHFAQWLVAERGVAVVPGSSFYKARGAGSNFVRFAFPKRMETLERAAPRLLDLPRESEAG
ncbi:MAG: pyridoxal phosphate-dependent aminotransferase [Chloroflexota bacterium]|nr:MAG: aminotransferase [Chloroflexota bacterium]